MEKETPRGDESSGGNATSEFERFLAGFAQYVDRVTTGDVEQMRDAETRAIAQIYADTAIAISKQIRTDFGGYYANASAESRHRLDRATARLGGNTAVEGALKLMDEAASSKGGMWDRINEVSELLKKILRGILDIELFGMSLNDLLGKVFDIDGALEILDNILRVLKKLLGREDVADRMYRTELQVLTISGERRRAKAALMGYLRDSDSDD